MKLKAQEKFKIPSEVNAFFNFKIVRSIFVLVSVIITSLLLIYYGAILQRDQTMASAQQLIFNGLKTNVSVISNYFKGVFSSSERIYIDIDFKGIQALNFARESALNQGTITENEQSISVKAKLTVNKETYKVKLSPTGLNLDMIGNIDKRAYKVKVSDGKKIFGMSEFKLLPPSARHHIVEWIGHELEKKEGLVALRYFFAEATLNGKDLGVYAVEEHFNKELLENNQSREGLIFAEQNNKIKVFNEKKYSQDGQKNNQIRLLRAAIEGLKKDEIDIDRLFDLEKYAKHLAIIDLMYSFHAFGINAFYYFNPVTTLVEPITREYNSLRYSEGPPNQNNFASSLYLDPKKGYLFLNKLFKNNDFIKFYLKHLERISQKEYLDSFFESVEDDLNKQMGIIYKDSPFYIFPKEYLYLRQDQIKKWLNRDLNVIANGYLDENNQQIIRVSNNSIFPIQLTSLYSDINDQRFNKDTLIQPNHSYVISAEELGLTKVSDLIVKYKIFGIQNIERELNLILTHSSSGIAMPEIWNTHYFETHDQIIVDRKNMLISFRDSKIDIEEDLFIPSKYVVIGKPGLIINLMNKASIYSRSSFSFKGSPDNPILITSSDRLGGGIAIFNSDEKNSFQNTKFEFLSSPNPGVSGLTASLSIYDSSVSFDMCTFEKNQAEDFLNLIQSEYSLVNSEFSFVKSDALDSDFSNGTIRNISFYEVGNDALDFSGSNSNLSYIDIQKIGDKAISAGEKTTLTGDQISIFGAEIGITSKDKSVVDLNDVKIKKTNLGFAIYKKKEEFGAAIALISKLEMNEVNLDHLVETDSVLILDSIEIEKKQPNVSDLLYGVVYGKSSKI